MFTCHIAIAPALNYLALSPSLSHMTLDQIILERRPFRLCFENSLINGVVGFVLCNVAVVICKIMKFVFHQELVF